MLRFTQAATRLINLIDADIGRSLSHLSTHFEYPPFLNDIRKAIADQVVVEMDMSTRENVWYSAKVVPYRDQKGQVNGAVVTFISVDSLRQAKKRLQDAGL